MYVDGNTQTNHQLGVSFMQRKRIVRLRLVETMLQQLHSTLLQMPQCATTVLVCYGSATVGIRSAVDRTKYDAPNMCASLPNSALVQHRPPHCLDTNIQNVKRPKALYCTAAWYAFDRFCNHTCTQTVHAAGKGWEAQRQAMTDLLSAVDTMSYRKGKVYK